MKLIKSKKALVLLATFVVAIAATVGAYAYWTTGGTGSGSATTGSTVGITVNQTSVNAALYPGGLSNLSGNFTNTTNPGNVYVTSVSASIDTFSVPGDLSKPACTQADFFLTGSPTLVGQDITPGAANGSWSGIVLHMTNAATNQDNCKNITVPLSYTSN